jgi:excisionase family DNA binding protein
MSKARNRIRLDVATPGESGVPLLTTGEVAKHLGVSLRYVTVLIDKGKLMGIRLPYSNHRRVHPAALKDFEERHGFTKARGVKRTGD